MEKNKKCSFGDDERQEIVNAAHHHLFSEQGKVGRDYLKSRGITSETAKIFKLGYCPDIALEKLANRIIVPCFDIYSKCVGISARKLTSDKESKPHWWNEASFEKGKYLFGLYQTKKHILESRYAILVEGQFDVICLYQSGVKNVVGLYGTTFNDRRKAHLRGYCKEIVSLLDEDNAGQIATGKIVKKLKKANFKYGVAHLPEKCDPDEYIMKFGVKNFQNLLDKSRKHGIIDAIGLMETLNRL